MNVSAIFLFYTTITRHTNFEEDSKNLVSYQKFIILRCQFRQAKSWVLMHTINMTIKDVNNYVDFLLVTEFTKYFHDIDKLLLQSNGTTCRMRIFVINNIHRTLDTMVVYKNTKMDKKTDGCQTLRISCSPRQSNKNRSIDKFCG